LKTLLNSLFDRVEVRRVSRQALAPCPCRFGQTNSSLLAMKLQIAHEDNFAIYQLRDEKSKSFSI
jgi:hypothetical protein